MQFRQALSGNGSTGHFFAYEQDPTSEGMQGDARLWAEEPE